MRLYHYNRYGRNFGDALSVVVVNALSRFPLETINGCTPSGVVASQGSNLVAIGSILHLAGPHDHIWGTGINTTVWPHARGLRGWLAARRKAQTLRSLRIHALRGPLTHEFLRARFGINGPHVFGDPALLLPRFHAGKHVPVRRLGIIPHYRDLEAFTDRNDVLSPYTQWQEVVTFLLGCELVVASSLHALIVAESYGVPARWLRNRELPSYHTESAFKFNDYYGGTGREPDQFSTSVEEAVRRGGATSITGFDADALMAAFPLPRAEITSSRDQ